MHHICYSHVYSDFPWSCVAPFLGYAVFCFFELYAWNGQLWPYLCCSTLVIKQKLPGIYVQPSYRSALSKNVFLHSHTECSYAAFHSTPKEFPTSCLEMCNRMCGWLTSTWKLVWNSTLCQDENWLSCEYAGMINDKCTNSRK